MTVIRTIDGLVGMSIHTGGRVDDFIEGGGSHCARKVRRRGHYNPVRILEPLLNKHQ